MISEDISSWFNANLFSGLDSVLHSAGYDISVFPIVTAQERKAFFEQLPVRRNADAVIVSSFAINPDEVPRLQSVRLPIVVSTHLQAKGTMPPSASMTVQVCV